MATVIYLNPIQIILIFMIFGFIAVSCMNILLKVYNKYWPTR